MGQNLQVRVPLDKLKDRVCECGNGIFTQIVALKVIPPMYSPSGIYESAITPIGFQCVGCGSIISLRPEATKDSPKIVSANS